jgi:trk system potassium uptake protein TrkA
MINAYDVRGIVGNATSYNVLSEANITRADLIISVTESDEINILCCLIAKHMGAKHTIARVRDPIYSQQINFMRDELGLNMIINPEYEAALDISRVLRFPSAIKIDIFAKGRVELAEIKINAGNILHGLALSELQKKIKTKVLICVVKRNDDIYIPKGDFILSEGDYIYITASHANMANFFRAIGIYREKAKSVMIIGGSDIAYYLAKQIDGLGMFVKILEFDKDRCMDLSDMLPGVRIINGDGTDRALLLEERLDEVDACVTLTGIDEENILVSLFAKKLKVDKVITKVDRSAFTDILDELGIDTIVSPKTITAGNILKYIRILEYQVKYDKVADTLQTLYKIVDGKVEAIEFKVKDTEELCRIPLRNLKLKKGILIACLIKGNAVMFPFGDDMIEAGDTVIVITSEHIIKELSDILE